MNPTEREQIKRWVETWQRAGAALRQMKRQELRSPDYGKNSALIDELLEWAVEHQKVRTSSGLVEQQRMFMKMRKRLAV
jgi:hypothetical protein